jgi:hypothetical protein
LTIPLVVLSIPEKILANAVSVIVQMGGGKSKDKKVFLAEEEWLRILGQQ